MANLIPFDDRDGFIWFNGKMVPWRDAKIHVLNHGLHYASCVFEGVRVYKGKVFKITEHSERLHKSAQMIGFKIPYTIKELNTAIEEEVRAQNIINGYVRPVAWLGSEQMAIMTDRASVNVAIAAWEWPSYFGDEAKNKGLKLTFAKWRRPSPDAAPTASKAAGLYMICTLSKNAAVKDGFGDAIMLDYRGFIAEATGANFFMVVNGKLHTPTPDCFLDGITRRTVIDLARKRGIEVIERHIKPEELAEGQEAFLTGSAAEVTPICSIGDYNFTVGPITRQMMDDYTILVNGG